MSKTDNCCGSKGFGRKLGFVISFLLLVDFSAGDDPCSEFVEYKTDDNNASYALVKVPRKNGAKEIRLLLSVQLAGDQDTPPVVNVMRSPALDNTVHYNVSLPVWKNCENRILGISVDNRVICNGAALSWDPPCTGKIYWPTMFTVLVREPPETLNSVVSPEKVTQPHTNTYSMLEPPRANNEESQPAHHSTEIRGSSASDSVNSKSYPYVDTCGTFLEVNHLIYNGKTVTEKTDFPWLVAMFRKSILGLKFLCGGTLISKKHVVTAGHCVNFNGRILPPQDLVLLLGRKNLQSWANDGAVFVEPDRIIIHPDFKATSADADIALLVFSEEITFTDNMKPVCLWTGNNSLQNMVNRMGVVVGWGRDEYGQILSMLPKELTMPIVEQQTCLWSHKAFRDITSDRTFCAGNRNDSGPCNGDIGGGFVMKVDDKWILRGIISLSINKVDRTCDLSHYVVFADTSKFTDWFLSNIT